MSARVVPDPRRWAALQCSGIYLLLMSVQSWYEDMLGALEADQLELARYAARGVIRDCLQIHAVAAEGQIEDEGDVLTDPYAGVPPERVRAAHDAVHGVVAAADVAAARLAVAAIEEQIDDVVGLLGFAQAPPSIRTPAGLFPALRITRDLLPINREAHLPLVLPEAWVSPSGVVTGQ